MIDHVIALYRPFVETFVVVVAPSFERQVRAHFAAQREDVAITIQEEPTGMLDAILVPLEHVERHEPDQVWVTWCDQIAVMPSTVRSTLEAFASKPAPALVMPTMQRSEPYIHFERDVDGRLVRVLQRREGAMMPPVGEGDIGLFAMTSEAYARRLPEFALEAQLGAGTGERNFLPFIPWLARRAHVQTIPATDAMESIGINTPEELALVSQHLMKESS
jgi:molybdopterin-guanine dinucleotide biosynthesis protein A